MAGNLFSSSSICARAIFVAVILASSILYARASEYDPDDIVEQALAQARDSAEETCGEVLATAAKALNNLALDYRRYLTTYRHTPSRRQLIEFLKITDDTLEASLAESNLEDIEDLERVVRKKNATTKLFDRVIDRKLFSPERREAITTALKKRSRIVITSAGAGKVDALFFESLLTYCQKMDAELFILPSNMRTEGLDPRLLETPGVHIVTHDIMLGDATIYGMAIPETRRNPFTNLETLGDRMGLQIVGFPKLLDIQTPSLHNDFAPNRMMATGTLTAPFQEAAVRGLLPAVASREQMFGAIILEKHLGDPRVQTVGAAPGMHARHIEYVPGQGFSDQGLQFRGGEVKKDGPLAVSLGDIHVGQTDPMLIDALVNQILPLKPKYIFLHDLFNGQSISHHEFNNIMTRMDLARAGKLNLKKEIHQIVSFINALTARLPGVKIVVAASNHDYWLKRRLEDAQKVMADLTNAEMSISLWDLHNQQPDIPPLLQAMRMFHLDHPERLLFLKHGQSFELGELIDARLKDHETQLGLHGHAGANGGHGSLMSLMRGVFSSISGDSHTADRRNQAIKAGTLTQYKLGYNNEGFSSWAQAVVLFYASSSKQTLRFSRGSFYTPASYRPQWPENFFKPGFPRVQATRSDGDEFKD